MEGPIIEVSHLPSAAGFFATTTQPLGIYYLSASPARLHFGFVGDQGPKCVFILQQSAVFPPRPSHITLLAQSPAAVRSFYKLCLRANPDQRDNFLCDETDEDTRAQARDLDGNMVEAVYSIQRRPVDMGTSKEARRVLEWQQDVARSVDIESSPTSSVASTPSVIRDSRPPVTYRRVESYPSPSTRITTERPLRLVRRDTVTTETYRRPDEKSNFSSGVKLVGTLVGAAAGASLAYSLLQDKDRQPPPVRRASYDVPPSSYTPMVQKIPGSARSKGGWEGERGYVAQYTITTAPHRTDNGSVRSGRTMKYSTRERSRSETGSRYERPLTVLPGPPGSSHHGSHKSERSHRSDERSSYHTASRKDGSYVSRENAPYEEKIQYVMVERPVERDQRDRRSNVSARVVPLPKSVVGGYAASLAPSDSVSSVGTKRERERLRERMRERW